MERRRFGQVGRLKPEKRDEYVRLHAEVWPDVLNMITACNLENYSIFIRGNVVFSYFEYTGTDYEADMAKMAADETVDAEDQDRLLASLLPMKPRSAGGAAQDPALRSMTRPAKRRSIPIWILFSI